MLQRLYVNNFRCLVNFELKTKEMPSSLIIGKNGAGKSTIADALEIFQRVGRGIHRVGQIVQEKDFAFNRSEAPMRFEIEVLLSGKLYHYILALELPETFHELRVFEEALSVAGDTVFSRKQAQVTVPKNSQSGMEAAKFFVDWHLVALPVIQERSEKDPLHIFKTWLAHTIILAPIPRLITGVSSGETLEPKRDGSNLGEWLSGLLGQFPAAYMEISRYLSEMMPDLSEYRNDPIGKDAKCMNVFFGDKSANFSVSFEDLSDGEKCFFLCAVVLAANKAYGPLFCFWDEPDNFLSLSEVGHFTQELRRVFQNGGQLIVSSHNDEAIRKFSNENTWILDRKSHLEPTLIKLLEEVQLHGDLIEALICDDLRL
ncbi:MAG: AAA family ATPase [Methylomonas sp.]|jgi:ABC-type cobalamin/Fe3+-siderophores transport system ATPase subunit